MSGGHFDYIQWKLNDVSSEIEEIIGIDEQIRSGEIQCREEVNLSAIRKVTRGNTRSMRIDTRFLSYEDAYDTLLKEGYHIEEYEGQKSFKAIKSNVEYEVDEIIDYRYFKGDEEVFPYDYSNETIEELRRGVDTIKKASTYIQRIDWLLSGDDGEESFHERLKQDLQDLENK